VPSRKDVYTLNWECQGICEHFSGFLRKEPGIRRNQLIENNLRFQQKQTEDEEGKQRSTTDFSDFKDKIPGGGTRLLSVQSAQSVVNSFGVSGAGDMVDRNPR
jgi:hypothetical protein